MADAILIPDAIRKKLIGFSESLHVPSCSSLVVFSCGEAIFTRIDAVFVVVKCDLIALASLNRGGNKCGSDGEGDSAKHYFVVVFVVVFVLIINSKNSSAYILII